MAQTYNSKRLRHLKASQARLKDQLRVLAKQIGEIIQRFAVGPLPSERVIPTNRATRENLNQAIWKESLRPYFIGSGDEPYTLPQQAGRGRPTANSPYARLIFEDVREAIALEADRQASIIEKYATDRVVRQWFMGPRPFRIGEQVGPQHTVWYDPFHLFVYQNSSGQPYVLSDAIWDTAQTSRKTIDGFLAFYIADGSSAVDIAEILGPWLVDGTTTRKPYGTLGMYSALRLARTEITAAAGRAYVNAALVNPWIKGTRWTLSGSHPDVDICDTNAHGGVNGDGVYPTDNLPSYPAHPHELCHLSPVVVDNPATVTRELRQMIDQAQASYGLSDQQALDVRTTVGSEYFDILQVQGAFNRTWMADALTYGQWITGVLGATL